MTVVQNILICLITLSVVISFNFDLSKNSSSKEELISAVLKLEVKSESPLIEVKDSSQYSEKFLNNLKKLNQFKSIELIDEIIVLDRKDTFLFPVLPEYMMFTGKKDHIAVALTLRRINFTNAEYKAEIVEFGNSSISEEGIAEIQPNFFLDSLTDYNPFIKKQIFVNEFSNSRNKKCKTIIRLGNIPNYDFCRLIKNCNDKIKNLTEDNYIPLHRKH